MNENLEIEYKMMVSKEEFDTLRKLCPEQTCLVQRNVYYDCTPSTTLKRMAMRIRDLEDRHIFTLKIPVEQGVREIEMDLPENSVEAFNDPQIRELFASLDLHYPVVSLGEMTTHRYLRVYPEGELCMDYSIINGRDDYEIEFEISTDPVTGKAFFLDLLHQAGLEYRENHNSKFARCVLNK